MRETLNSACTIAEHLVLTVGGNTVRDSVLDAIKQGQWDFEPESVDNDDYDSTRALPGTSEKITKLAERVQGGLPLWHPEDRRSYDDSDEAFS